MADRWIITNRRYHQHVTHDGAITELARLQTLKPDAKFRVFRIKTSVARTDDFPALLEAIEAIRDAADADEGSAAIEAAIALVESIRARQVRPDTQQQELARG